METTYYFNKFGIPEALWKALMSFIWTCICIGLAYISTRLNVLGTTEAVGLATAIRTLVSFVAEWLHTPAPKPVVTTEIQG